MLHEGYRNDGDKPRVDAGQNLHLTMSRIILGYQRLISLDPAHP